MILKLNFINGYSFYIKDERELSKKLLLEYFNRYCFKFDEVYYNGTGLVFVREANKYELKTANKVYDAKDTFV